MRTGRHPGRASSAFTRVCDALWREPGSITTALAILHSSWLWVPDSRCAASGMTGEG
jgi:hypothetical protein